MADYDYAASQGALARKRKLAEMLQQQAFAPVEMPTVPGAKLSPWTIALKGLMGGMSAYAGNQADEAAKADAAALNAKRAELLSAPDGSSPGVDAQPIAQESTVPPEVPPAPPPEAPPPAAAAFGASGMPDVGPRDNELKGSASPLAAGLVGGAPPDVSPLLPKNPLGAEGAALPGAQPPLLPRVNPVDMAGPGMKPKLATDAILPKLPTADSFRKKGEGLLALGDPTSLAMGKEYFTKGVDADAPMTRKDTAELGQKKELAIAALDERHQNLLREMKRDDITAQQRADLAKQANDTKLQIAQMGADSRRDVAAMIHAGKGDKSEGGTVSGGHTNINGDILSYNAHTGKFTNTRTGQEHIQTDADPIIQREDRKEILDTTKLLTSAGNDRDLATAIREDAKANPGKGAYSGGNNMRAVLSAATSGIVDPAEKMKAEQQILRSNVTRDIAQEMHTLYGASFTTSEQKQASDIMKMPFSSGEQMARKLEAQANFREQMAREHSPKALTVAQARVAATRSKSGGGGDAPAAAPQSSEVQSLVNQYQTKKPK